MCFFDSRQTEKPNNVILFFEKYYLYFDHGLSNLVTSITIWF